MSQSWRKGLGWDRSDRAPSGFPYAEKLWKDKRIPDDQVVLTLKTCGLRMYAIAHYRALIRKVKANRWQWLAWDLNDASSTKAKGLAPSHRIARIGVIEQLSKLAGLK
jgi:hypothetical protein